MKSILVFLATLFFALPASGQELRLHVAGFAGVHVFDSETDLHEEIGLTTAELENSPQTMLLLGGLVGLDWKQFTAETGLGVVPTWLKESDDLAPVFTWNVSGLYRFEKLVPYITPFVKVDVGIMGVFSGEEKTGTDLDLYVGLGLGGIYHINKKLFARLDLSWIVGDGAEAAISNNIQVRAMVGWHLDMATKDKDGDGIPDDKDKCPTAAEDKDGFEDSDGCPDADNDQDGVPDDQDKCRGTDADKASLFAATKEDKDGFEDGDGCPDKDNDGDGIADGKDKCPGTDADAASGFVKTKEDKDGFKDKDGCPEADNDMDGVPDGKDKCPTQKEDQDGYKDGDGCPDPDNDGDGVPDTADQCRGTDADAANGFSNTKEDKDGFKDDDGCPDLDNDLDGIPDGKDKCPGKDADLKNGLKGVKEVINGYKDYDGCPDKRGKVRVKVLADRIKLLKKIRFKVRRGKTTIHRKSVSLVKQLALHILANPRIKQLSIDVHTDSSGKASKAKAFTQTRADVLRAFLIKEGVAPGRLIANGYGGERPLGKNCEKIKSRRRRRRCRRKNRRMELLIK